MKFLLAISSTQYSGPTLKVGALIAQAFKAELSVVYVGNKASQMHGDQVDMARDNLSKWNIYHPGLEVLKWALSELKKVCPDDTGLQAARFNPEYIRQEGNAVKVILPNSNGCRIELILREGELIQELRDELQSEKYDLSIIGGSQGKRKLAHDLIQFLPSSVFVTRGFRPRKKYKLLLLVDDSEATKRSVRFAAEIAKTERWEVRTLTVSKNSRFGPGYTGAAKQAKDYFEKNEIAVEQFFLTGDPVKTFVDFAGDDHIIIMGSSQSHPLLKLLRGSKPIKTLERSTGPILIVR